jgi:CMP-N-acetylneuraminic acid synthetase
MRIIKNITLALLTGRNGEKPNLNLENNTHAETELQLPHSLSSGTTAVQLVKRKKTTHSLLEYCFLQPGSPLLQDKEKGRKVT